MRWPEFDPRRIVAVDVWLEFRKTRVYAGRLEAEGQSGRPGFVFQYDENYLYAKSSIPLGPEMPLTAKTFRSDRLFRSLDDRIPSSENPVYPEYCDDVGISPDEKNPIILLATIGRRGPSSFVFEPVYADAYNPEDAKKFREDLGLTVREFASVFQVSAKSVSSIEASSESAGKETLKRMALYDRFPETALYQLTRCGGALHEAKRQLVSERLRARIEERQKQTKP